MVRAGQAKPTTRGASASGSSSARVLGLGGGTAWFRDEEQQRQAKAILGIPQERAARSVVVLGYPTTTKDPRPNPAASGRKLLSEIVSYGRMDAE